MTTIRGCREGTREFLDRGPLTPQELAQRVARDIPAGSYVNLGIGQPTRVADYLAQDSNVVLHTENGMLGMGPRAHGSLVDPDLVNAGKVPVTELPGASYFHQADSFAMMRGGHLDFCVLGAYQVSSGGDLANWHTDRAGAVPAVGGAMDLAVGARTVYVMMSLFDKSGSSKLVTECTYSLTGHGCVDRVYSTMPWSNSVPTELPSSRLTAQPWIGWQSGCPSGFFGSRQIPEMGTTNRESCTLRSLL